MIINLSPYQVDDTLSRYGGKVVLWKVGDMIYGLRFLSVVVTFHALHSDVFERLSVSLKRIGYYALRLVFNGVFNINLLVLNFRFGFRLARFGFFTRILVIRLYLS